MTTIQLKLCTGPPRGTKDKHGEQTAKHTSPKNNNLKEGVETQDNTRNRIQSF